MERLRLLHIKWTKVKSIMFVMPKYALHWWNHQGTKKHTQHATVAICQHVNTVSHTNLYYCSVCSSEGSQEFIHIGRWEDCSTAAYLNRRTNKKIHPRPSALWFLSYNFPSSSTSDDLGSPLLIHVRLGLVLAGIFSFFLPIRRWHTLRCREWWWWQCPLHIGLLMFYYRFQQTATSSSTTTNTINSSVWMEREKRQHKNYAASHYHQFRIYAAVLALRENCIILKGSALLFLRVKHKQHNNALGGRRVIICCIVTYLPSVAKIYQ